VRDITNARRPVVRVVHSSDLHIGMDEAQPGVARLETVLGAALEARADLVVLAGDVFDHNRVGLEVLDLAADALAAASIRTVILPGNHDCLTQDSVYRRGRFGQLRDVHVLGVTTEDSSLFPDIELEVWGRAHLDHFDMTPLRDPPPRRLRWQIAAAHGHWVSGPHDSHRAYLIHQHELEATGADYVALGHWDRWTKVGAGKVAAYYSGSPTLAKSVNLIELGNADGVRVERLPLTR
jgi:DNA repair exonuclease SbcCD nuclease subunit